MAEYLKHWQFWFAVLIVVAIGNYVYHRLPNNQGS